MENPVTRLFEALEASELTEKDEFKRKIVSCIDMLDRSLSGCDHQGLSEVLH